MDSALQLVSQSAKVFKTLPASKQVTLFFVVVITLVSIAAFVLFENQKEYRILFSNLSTEDAGDIVARLQETKTPYTLSAGGDSISVPSEDVATLRLDLATEGLPRGGGVGFEIFDSSKFGITEFEQRLNYQRALQGELSRTINGLDEVQRSRVHIVLPRKSLFVEEQAKPTVSVFVKTKAGRNLQPSQIDGIAHLVAASVEGLSPSGVMIVDGAGNVLTAAGDDSQVSSRANSQIEYQRKVEKDLGTSIKSMLEKVVGAGNVVARVSASIDFKVMEKTEETYDPEEPVIRSLHRRSEKTNASTKSGESSVGTAGTEKGRDRGSGSERADEVINYEINRVISKTVMPVGEIEKLSVGVLVDGIYKKNKEGVEEFQPRPKKEIETLADFVKKSIGFDARRGDQVVVTSVPFRKNDFEVEPLPEEGFLQGMLHMMAPLARHLASLIALLLVLLFVLRPLVKFVMAHDRGGERGGRSVRRGLVTAGDEMDAGDESFELEGERPEIDQVRALANQDAQVVAEVMKDWIK